MESTLTTKRDEFTGLESSLLAARSAPQCSVKKTAYGLMSKQRCSA